MHRSIQLLIVLMLVLLAGTTVGQERVLVVGDSWAGGFWFHRTLSNVFASNGRPDVTEWGGQTAIGGTTAADWRQPDGLQTLTDALNSRPSIDTVQLTAGGNDLLAGPENGGWFVGMSPAAQDALLARVTADIMAVADHVTARSPSMEVVVSLYDYLNFVDFSGDCGEAWRELGSPTPRQINEAVNLFHDTVAAAAVTRPRVTVIDHRGLMQSHFGFPDDGIPPGTIQPPGDLDRPSPRQSLDDCIHLNPSGLSAVGQHLWRTYYNERFNGSGGDGGDGGGDGGDGGDGGGNDGGGNSPRVRMADSSLQVAEDGIQARLRIELSETPQQVVSVSYSAAGGTAAAGQDFEATSGTLTWNPGDGLPQSVDVRLFDDALPEGNESFRFSLGNVSGGQLNTSRSTTDVTILDDDGLTVCVPGLDVHCLQNGRFRVEVDWLTDTGNAGRGMAQPLSDTSGLFWFFTDDNIEMLFKIIDGCSFEGLEGYWVFLVATTNVEYALRVTDTSTGRIREYVNAQGTVAQPVQDLQSFTDCP